MKNQPKFKALSVLQGETKYPVEQPSARQNLSIFMLQIEYVNQSLTSLLGREVCTTTHMKEDIQATCRL